jgi:phosphoribosylformylglycinamidine (FGAM) synthase PurS component
VNTFVKFVIIVFILYGLYYTVLIVNDLFFKKVPVPVTDEGEMYSLDEFAESIKEDVKGVGIDDVENLNTPKSFNTSVIMDSDSEDDSPDINILKEKYDSNTNHFQDTISNSNNSPAQKETKPEPVKSSDSEDHWQNLLNMAETSVQIVSDNQGYKVYKAII